MMAPDIDKVTELLRSEQVRCLFFVQSDETFIGLFSLFPIHLKAAFHLSVFQRVSTQLWVILTFRIEELKFSR